MTVIAESVVLFGEFGCGNLGNEASLDAVLAWIRTRPEITIGSITREPDVVAREHAIASVSMFGDRSRLSWLPRPLRKVAQKLSDPLTIASRLRPGQLVVVPGTGVFEQAMSGPPWGLPLSMFGLALAVRARRARLALVGVGASYDTRRSVRLLTRGIVALSEFVSVRDEYSKAAFGSIGADATRTTVFPDVAFSLVEDVPGDVVAPATGPAEGGLRVGLGVISYHDPDDHEGGQQIAQEYEATITEFCGWLVDQGHQVELLVGDASDGPLAEQVVAAVAGRGPGRACFAGYPDYRSLLHRVRSLDVVVGSRYHNLIFGLMNGTPVMSVGYADKCERLLAAAGLGSYALRLERVTVDDLQHVFGDLIAHLPQATRSAQRYRTDAAAGARAHRDLFLTSCLQLEPVVAVAP
ncbi:MAG: polysaccharide pyruvyl transferase family protein [Propionibacteriaceae bacterium]